MLLCRLSAASSPTQYLWKECITATSHWWDELKSNKVSSQLSDVCCTVAVSARTTNLKHKTSCYNPSWVKDMLHKTESKPHELREISGWGMLSLEEALTSLERITQPPSVKNFTSILQKCRKRRDVVYALRLHSYMCKSGLDKLFGNYLVPLLVEVGSVHDARQVFDSLTDRNEYSWTSLITGYIECGESQQALMLYKKMLEDSVDPSGHTFVALIKACSMLKDVEKGREIHSEIARKGFEKDLFVGSALVDMYAKCGSLGKAQEVFDTLAVRDIVSWNAVIAGYAQHGLGEEALKCFEKMQLEGVSPNAVTFICSLKACGSIGAIDKGQELYGQIVRKGLLETDLVVGSTLVDMYAKCGFPAKAQEAFDKLPIRNVVSWTALIAGYAESGLGQEALNCFEQMHLEGVSPNSVTFVCSLKACGSIAATAKGQEMHAEITRKRLERDSSVGNALIDMYAKFGLLAKAQEVFDKLPVRDEVSWNALIAGYANHALGQEALNCFKQMQLEGISPNAVTFICCIKACGIIGAIDKCQEIHAMISQKGLLESDLVIGNVLVDMYAKCGLPNKAREVFDKLPVRNDISWNALIIGYANHTLGEEALNCFEQMQLEGISKDAITFVGSLKACGSIGAIDKGLKIHAEICSRKGMLERHHFVGNALIDMYAKCGSLAKAQEVFDELPNRNEVSWNALIAGYARLGESEDVFFMLDRMRGEGIQPDGVTLLSVLTVCSHTGLVDKGQTYFEAMSKDYGIIPTIEHHSCMVDLLGRAGQLDEAIVMMKKMPFNLNLVVWHTVLGACRKWGNVELGNEAFEHTVQMDEKDAAAYVLMSNIHADVHMWEDEKMVEAMRVKE